MPKKAHKDEFMTLLNLKFIFVDTSEWGGTNPN